MKLTLDRDPLLAAVTRVSGALAGKSASPVFSHILLGATDKLTLRAMSADMQATITLDADIAEPGAITAPGDELAKIAAALAPGAQVKVARDGERCVISAGRSRFKLPTVAPDLMAEWPGMDDATVIEMPARVLKSALDRTLFDAAKDSNKGPVVQGVYVHGDGVLKFAATNTHRLALVTTDIEIRFKGVVLTAGFCSEAVRVLDGTGSCTLSLGPSRSQLYYGPLRIVSKVIDGMYVPYERVIPAHTDTLIVDRADLASSMKRIAAVAASERSVRLKVKDGGLTIDGRTMESAEALDELECERVGGEFTMSLNSGYLGDALSHLEETRVTFQTGDGAQSVVIVEGDLTQTIGIQRA